MLALVLSAALLVALTAAPHLQQSLVPKWTPTYNMSLSTILQPCNYSGLYDYDAYPALARFGIVDYECVLPAEMSTVRQKQLPRALSLSVALHCL
jgi:hypothetical protein